VAERVSIEGALQRMKSGQRLKLLVGNRIVRGRFVTYVPDLLELKGSILEQWENSQMYVRVSDISAMQYCSWWSY
jgi:hypothetical protein